LRAMVGLDERKMGVWLTEGSKAAGTVIAAGASKVGPVAKVAGRQAQKGARSYVNWFFALWAKIFGLVAKLLTFIWAVLTLPFKLFSSKSSKPTQLPASPPIEKRNPAEFEDSGEPSI